MQANDQPASKPALPVLARLPKRHYTFARCRPDRFTTVRIRRAKCYLKALIRLTICL
jgi:hypothetical protein